LSQSPPRRPQHRERAAARRLRLYRHGLAYRVERDGKLDLESRAGAVEQGLFQLVLDHEDNRKVLARQATERLPVSRTYMPT
jgi:hypothetical protein